MKPLIKNKIGILGHIKIITIEEAMNPLTFIATGVYGNPLQNKMVLQSDL